MANAGELTTAWVREMTKKALPGLEKEFAKTNATITQSYNVLGNTVGRLFGKDSKLGKLINDFLKDTNTQVEKLQNYLKNFTDGEMKNVFEAIEAAAWALGLAIAGKGIAGAVSIVMALVAAAKAANLATVALTLMGRTPVILALAGVVAGVTWALGKLRMEAEKNTRTFVDVNKEIKFIEKNIKEAVEAGNGESYLVDGWRDELKKLKAEYEDLVAKALKAQKDLNAAKKNTDVEEVVEDEKPVEEVVEKKENTDVVSDLKNRIGGLSDAATTFSKDEFGGEVASPYGAEAVAAEIERMLEAGEIKKETAVELEEELQKALFEVRQKYTGINAEARADEDEKNSKRRTQVANEELEWEELSAEAKQKIIVDNVRKTASILANHNKAAFRLNQAFALKDAIIETHKGIAKAVGSAPFPANIPAIAFATATGFAQVSAIASQGGGGGGSRGASSSAASPAPVSQPATTFTNATQVADGLGETATQRKEILLNFGDRNIFNKEDVKMIVTELAEAADDGVVANVSFVGA